MIDDIGLCLGDNDDQSGFSALKNDDDIELTQRDRN